MATKRRRTATLSAEEQRWLDSAAAVIESHRRLRTRGVDAERPIYAERLYAVLVRLAMERQGKRRG